MVDFEVVVEEDVFRPVVEDVTRYDVFVDETRYVIETINEEEQFGVPDEIVVEVQNLNEGFDVVVEGNSSFQVETLENVFTIDPPNDALRVEQIQDAVFSNITGSGGITVSYDDVGDSFDIDGGGVVTEPAGSDMELQFNDAGSFGASPGLTFDKTVNELNVAGQITVGSLQLGTANAKLTPLTNDVVSSGHFRATFDVGIRGNRGRVQGLARSARNNIFYTGIFSEGVEVATFNEDGVGIGVDPSTRLHVAGDGVSDLFLIEDQAGNSLTSINSDGLVTINPGIDNIDVLRINDFDGSRIFRVGERGQFGVGRNANPQSNFNAIAIGDSASVTGNNGVAVGTNATAEKDGFASGTGSFAGEGATALGKNSSATSNFDVGIANRFGNANGGGSVAIGYQASTNAFRAFTIGTGNSSQNDEVLLNTRTYSTLMGHVRWPTLSITSPENEGKRAGITVNGFNDKQEPDTTGLEESALDIFGGGATFHQVQTPSIENVSYNGVDEGFEFTYKLWAVDGAGNRTLADEFTKTGLGFDGDSIRVEWEFITGAKQYIVERTGTNGGVHSEGLTTVSYLVDTKFLDNDGWTKQTWSDLGYSGPPTLNETADVKVGGRTIVSRGKDGGLWSAKPRSFRLIGEDGNGTPNNTILAIGDPNDTLKSDVYIYTATDPIASDGINLYSGSANKTTFFVSNTGHVEFSGPIRPPTSSSAILQLENRAGDDVFNAIVDNNGDTTFTFEKGGARLRNFNAFNIETFNGKGTGLEFNRFEGAFYKVGSEINRDEPHELSVTTWPIGSVQTSNGAEARTKRSGGFGVWNNNPDEALDVYGSAAFRHLPDVQNLAGSPSTTGSTTVTYKVYPRSIGGKTGTAKTVDVDIPSNNNTAWEVISNTGNNRELILDGDATSEISVGDTVQALNHSVGQGLTGTVLSISYDGVNDETTLNADIRSFDRDVARKYPMRVIKTTSEYVDLSWDWNTGDEASEQFYTDPVDYLICKQVGGVEYVVSYARPDEDGVTVSWRDYTLTAGTGPCLEETRNETADVEIDGRLTLGQVESTTNTDEVLVRNPATNEIERVDGNTLGGSGSPGGNNKNIQYNDFGSFAGTDDFVWDNGSKLLGINTDSPDHTITVETNENLNMRFTDSTNSGEFYQLFHDNKSTDGSLRLAIQEIKTGPFRKLIFRANDDSPHLIEAIGDLTVKAEDMVLQPLNGISFNYNDGGVIKTAFTLNPSTYGAGGNVDEILTVSSSGEVKYVTASDIASSGTTSGDVESRFVLEDVNTNGLVTLDGNSAVAKYEGGGAFTFGSRINGSVVGTDSVSIGQLNTASSDDSVALGFNVVSSGTGSVALGVGNTASNTGSTSSGFNSTAAGKYSLAVGNFAKANGESSFSMGEFTDAKALTSVALGNRAVSRVYGGLVQGLYNEDYLGSGSVDDFASMSDSDRVLAVGVGDDGSYDNLKRGDGFYVTYRDGSFVRGGLTIERFKTDVNGDYVKNGVVTEVETVLDVQDEIVSTTNTSEILVRDGGVLKRVSAGDVTGSTSRPSVSDDGTVVLGTPTDIDFGTDLSVSDDGDGTVTVNNTMTTPDVEFLEFATSAFELDQRDRIMKYGGRGIACNQQNKLTDYSFSSYFHIPNNAFPDGSQTIKCAEIKTKYSPVVNEIDAIQVTPDISNATQRTDTLSVGSDAEQFVWFSTRILFVLKPSVLEVDKYVLTDEYDLSTAGAATTYDISTEFTGVTNILRTPDGFLLQGGSNAYAYHTNGNVISGNLSNFNLNSKPVYGPYGEAVYWTDGSSFTREEFRVYDDLTTVQNGGGGFGFNGYQAVCYYANGDYLFFLNNAGDKIEQYYFEDSLKVHSLALFNDGDLILDKTLNLSGLSNVKDMHYSQQTIKSSSLFPDVNPLTFVPLTVLDGSTLYNYDISVTETVVDGKLILDTQELDISSITLDNTNTKDKIHYIRHQDVFDNNYLYLSGR